MNEGALPELPGGWVWTRLGDIIIKISNGITERQINEKSNIMVTRIETISKGFIDLNKVGYLKDLSHEEIEKYRLLPDDILFSHINSDLHLGKTAIFSFDSLALLHGMNLLLIRPDRECINPKILHYLCNYYRFSGTFISIAQHAVNQSSINQSKLKNLPIPLPPLPEQRRIVAKIEELFTKLDAGVSALQKTQAQLKRYRSSVLKAACEGKLVPTEAELAKAEGRAYEPADVLLARILKERREKSKGAKYKEPEAPDTNGTPKLPEGWGYTRLELSCNLVTKGESPNWQGFDYVDEGIPFIRSENVLWGNINLSNYVKIPEEFHKKLKRSHIRPNDVLINLVGASIGRCGIVPLSITDANINQAVALIRLNNSLLPSYLMHLLLSPQLQKKIHGSKVETARPNISLEDLRQLVVPLPPLAEQRRIVAEVERRLSVADEVARTVEQSLAQAGRLRQSILKKAFEGKLVAQDASDEPASVLLERIRQQKQLNNQTNRTTRRRAHGNISRRVV